MENRRPARCSYRKTRSGWKIGGLEGVIHLRHKLWQQQDPKAGVRLSAGHKGRRVPVPKALRGDGQGQGWVFSGSAADCPG